MKKSIKNKLIVLLLTMAIAMVGIVAISGMTSKNNEVSATNDPPTLTIVAKNLAYSDSNYLLYAIGSSGFDTEENEIQMLFWNESQTEYKKGTESYTKTNEGKTTVKGQSCLVFCSNGISAKNMVDDIYARAYVEINEVGYYSEVLKYSVLEYVYEMRENATLTTAQETAFTALLDYGAAIQTLLGHNTERLANANFNKISVVNGTLADATTMGRYLNEEKVTLIASEAPEGMEFSNWTDKDGAIVATTATAEIIVTGANTYTANYKEKHVHNYNLFKFDETYHWYECECGENSGLYEHRGGQASCAAKAVCSICGIAYGTILDHEYNILETDNDNHWYECACGKYIEKIEHFGGTATETERAVCEGCGESYGELFVHEGKVIVNLILTRTISGRVVECTLPEGYETQMIFNIGDVLVLPDAILSGNDEYSFKCWKYINDNGEEVEVKPDMILKQSSFPDLDFGTSDVEMNVCVYCVSNWSGYH